MTSDSLHLPNTALPESLFQQSPLPYLILQPQTLHIVKANAAAVAFFGSVPQHLHDQCFLSFIVPGKDTDAHGLLKKFTAGTPFFLRCKTGDSTTSVQVFQNPIPAATPLLGVMLVPATHAAASEKDDLITDMVDENADVLTAADLDFRPLTWSKASERLYGLSREQVLGKNVRDYLDIQYLDTTPEDVRQQTWAKGEWRGEMSFERPTDGKKMTLLTTFKLIRNKAGEGIHYFISGTDITDRKENEAKLRESENRFREVADSAPVGIWMSELGNKGIYINKPLADYIGVCPEVFTITAWISRIHPDDVHGVLKKFRSHFQQRLPVTLIYRLRRRCGAYHWMQDTGTPRFLASGAFLGYIGSMVDINETKQRETQLQYQATLIENIQDSVVTTDLDFKVQSWNKVAAEIYGFPGTETLGKPLPDLLHFRYVATTKEAAYAQWQATGVWKGEVDIDVRGEERNFLFTVTYITDAGGKRIGIMAVGREITDRKRAEQNLKASESFYRSLIADSVDGKLLTTEEGTITFASPPIQNILGYGSEELIGHNAFAFVHPDDLTFAWGAFQREISEKPEVKFVEIRIQKKDGGWLWCLVRGHNLLANPHINSMVISLHDDTQRKQATIALKESEQRFRALIKDLKMGVTLENAEGRILMYNKAAADLFRVSEDVFETTNVYTLFKKAVHEDESPFEQADWPMLQAARTKKPADDVVVGLCVADTNERIWLLVNANPVLDESGNIRHIISSFIDITERKNLVQRLMDEQMAQQRLLTQATIDGQERERKEIGKELHDNVGQQLATTKLYLDLARDAQSPEKAEMLARATKSISDVINEVRAISHSLVPPTLGDLGLAESVQDLVDAITLVQPLEIHFNDSGFHENDIPENGKLMLYRIIQEALNNIIKHAQARAVSIRLWRRNRQLLLEISDNGRGFTPETVRKGLGLNNIRNRAELFGGKVSIQAAPSAGCTLRVVIPVKTAN